jgi:hypothetical protein
MGFYYFSFLSLVPLGIAYGLLALIFWGIARLTRGIAGRKVLLSLVGFVFLILPVAEELWIAWNFGQACKEAGTFIYRTVQVEGFYDDTRPGRPGPLAEQAKKSMNQSGYLFYERPLQDTRGGPAKVVRFEKVGGEWQPMVLDQPTARFHFKQPSSNARVAHKIVKHETVVRDNSTGELLGKYTRFSRESPWFYVSLSNGDFSCDVAGTWPLVNGRFSIYRDVLRPVKK